MIHVRRGAPAIYRMPIWAAVTAFFAGLLLAAPAPFLPKMPFVMLLVQVSLASSLVLAKKNPVYFATLLVILCFQVGHQRGSYRFIQRHLQLPPNHELGQSFKIRARVVQQWQTQHQGLALSLDQVQILSPEKVAYRIPRLTAYLPPDIHPIRRHSYIKTWLTLKKKEAPKTFHWPMLILWESYRPSYYGSIKAKTLIEELTEDRTEGVVHLNPGNQQLIGLFLHGRSSTLWRNRLQPFGLGHLLAISGLHCLIVYLLIQALLIPLRGPWTRTLLTCVGLLLFAHHMGWSASVARATVMLLTWHLLPVLNRRRDPLMIWTVMLVASGFYDPLAVLSQGYWYTFSASLGLMLAAKPLEKSPLIHPWHYRIKRFLPIVGAQFMVLPIQLIFGIHAPLAGFLWNLIGGLVLCLLILLFGLSLIASFFPFLAPLPNQIESIFGKNLDFLTDILPNLEWVRFPHPPLVGLIILVLLAIVLKFGRREWRWYGACLVLFLFSRIHLPLKGAQTLILDVGQGSTMLHIDPSQRAWLFDAGGKMPRGVDFSRTIKLFGGKTIAAAFISHFNRDHFQLIEKTQSAFPLYLPQGQNQLFRQNHNLRRHHTQIPLQLGQKLTAGQLTIQVLLPTPHTSPPNTNEGSLVLLIDGPWGSLLFTGDAGSWAESRLSIPSRPSPRWLQVGHHGSRTATSSRLLSQFRPDRALISAGKNNPFGHPHRQVLNRLRDRGIPIGITSEKGSITLLKSNQPAKAKWEYILN